MSVTAEVVHRKGAVPDKMLDAIPDCVGPLLLKLDAPSNMKLMLVTFATFQAESSWLNPLAPTNIERMLVTALVFQTLMF